MVKVTFRGLSPGYRLPRRERRRRVGGARDVSIRSRPQAAAGNKKILRRERPVYPKTGQSHPKKLRYVWPLLPLCDHHHHEIQ
jgi:hypothetical protein